MDKRNGMTRPVYKSGALLSLAVLFLSYPALAQNVGDACTGTNRQYTVSGTSNSALICNGTTLELLEKDLSNPVRKGIGTATPAARLHVAGEAIIGNTSLACSGTTAGGMRWNSGSGCIQFCNGTSWACISPTAGCDATPAAFDFTDLNGLTASTLTSSDILSITGTDPACNAVVSVSGDGSPQFRVCSDSICSSVIQNWTATNTALDMNGRFLQIRATTDASPSTTVNVTATVGGVSNVWQITTTSTGPCGDVGPGDEGQICSDGSVYAGVTPDGNRNMYVPRCDVGMSWDGSNCTGTRSAPPWNNGNTSGYVLTGYTSYNNGSANTAGVIVLDSNSGVGGTQPHQAAQACADLNVHGKTDWYLPGYDELSVIYEKLVDGMPNDNNPDPLISGFATGDYWSSSEATNQYAWARQFTDGVGGNMNKQVASEFVRCARKD